MTPQNYCQISRTHEQIKLVKENLTIPLIKGTFQDSASKLFNILSDYIRNETDFSIFRSQTKLFLKERIIVGN